MPYRNHETLEMEKNGHRVMFCLRGFRDVREETHTFVFGKGADTEKKLVGAGNLTIYIDGEFAAAGSATAAEPFVLERFCTGRCSPTFFKIKGVKPAFEFPPDAAEEAERYEAWRKACFEKWETPEAKKLIRN